MNLCLNFSCRDDVGYCTQGKYVRTYVWRGRIHLKCNFFRFQESDSPQKLVVSDFSICLRKYAGAVRRKCVSRVESDLNFTTHRRQHSYEHVCKKELHPAFSPLAPLYPVEIGLESLNWIDKLSTLLSSLS